MNKSELIDAVAEQAQLTKKEAAAAVNAMFDPNSGAIIRALNSGRQVNISGFGKFERRTRAERRGRNPRTGAEIRVPASSTPAFKAGKTLKDNLR